MLTPYPCINEKQETIKELVIQRRGIQVDLADLRATVSALKPAFISQRLQELVLTPIDDLCAHYAERLQRTLRWLVIDTVAMVCDGYGHPFMDAFLQAKLRLHIGFPESYSLLSMDFTQGHQPVSYANIRDLAAELRFLRWLLMHVWRETTAVSKRAGFIHNAHIHELRGVDRVTIARKLDRLAADLCPEGNDGLARRIKELKQILRPQAAVAAEVRRKAVLDFAVQALRVDPERMNESMDLAINVLMHKERWTGAELYRAVSESMTPCTYTGVARYKLAAPLRCILQHTALVLDVASHHIESEIHQESFSPKHRGGPITDDFMKRLMKGFAELMNTRVVITVTPWCTPSQLRPNIFLRTSRRTSWSYLLGAHAPLKAPPRRPPSKRASRSSKAAAGAHKEGEPRGHEGATD